MLHLALAICNKGASSKTLGAYPFSRRHNGKWLSVNRKREIEGRHFSSQQNVPWRDQHCYASTISKLGDDSPYRSESTDDWFANRYQDKSFHTDDGLDPNEWLLVYRILDEHDRDRIMFSLYAVALGSIVCAGFFFAVCWTSHPKHNPFAMVSVFLLGAALAFAYATRLRRYGVVRLYSRRHEHEQWEKWRFTQLALQPSSRQIYSPVRFYCIVWRDFFHRQQLFSYNSRQITDAVHRPTWLARTMYGNFLVRGRPWAVHPEFFEEAADYIFIRRVL